MKFCRRLRFFLLQHFNRNANVVVDGIPNIHKDADVEVGKYSMLKIGYGFTMRKNSIIAVRDNAQLRIGCKVFIKRCYNRRTLCHSFGCHSYQRCASEYCSNSEKNKYRI